VWRGKRNKRGDPKGHRVLPNVQKQKRRRPGGRKELKAMKSREAEVRLHGDAAPRKAKGTPQNKGK